MGSTVFGNRKRRMGESQGVPARPERPRIPVGTLVRMFVLGSVSVIACIWALWRHYTVPAQPMLVPVSASSAVSPPGEIETTPSNPEPVTEPE